MQKLVKNSALLDNDPWCVVDKSCNDLQTALSQGEQLLLPLKLWLEQAETVATNKNIGVWLDSDEDADALSAYCEDLEIIAINFPVFSDGRGYSQARRLRLNYGYKKELRAIGDVLRDQMQFYQRCGFDSFALREDINAEQAIAGLNDFDIHYQDAADNYVPPFARH